MKSKTRFISLLVSVFLTLVVFGVNADDDDDHIDQAIKHAKVAAKASDGKTIAEHAEIAKTHAKESIEHLNAAISNLDGAIEHGKSAHVDLAKTAAHEAVTHLKEAE
jgi:hypothetical protein